MKFSRFILPLGTFFILSASCLTSNVTANAAPSPRNSNTTVVTKDYSGMLPGEWVIYKVNNKRVTGEERPYITFDSSQRRFYGTNGCNTINGDYNAGRNELTFTNVISTMRMCDDAKFEADINQAIDKVRTYSIYQNGNEYYMSLIDGQGTVVMILRKHNMNFLDGAWKVERLNGKKVKLAGGEEMKLVIDILGNKIHGHTGCNIINGFLFVDPDKESAMQFVDVVSTRMACENQEQENDFLLALESVEGATMLSNGKIALVDKRGKTVIEMSKLDLR